MESFIMAYIARRMTDLGFKQYSFEPFTVVLSDAPQGYHIEGTNEYYYLVSKTLVKGTEISSGNNYFKVEDYHLTLDYSKIQEFTGQITITLPQGTGKGALEFIRVLPVVLR